MYDIHRTYGMFAFSANFIAHIKNRIDGILNVYGFYVAAINVKRFWRVRKQAVRRLNKRIRADENKSLLLIYQLITKLSKRLRRDWELSLNNANHVPTFDELQKFLERRSQALEHYAVTSTHNEKSFNKDRTFVNNVNDKCPRCKKPQTIRALLFCPVTYWSMKKRFGDYLYNCPSFSNGSPEERYPLFFTKLNYFLQPARVEQGRKLRKVCFWWNYTHFFRHFFYYDVIVESWKIDNVGIEALDNLSMCSLLGFRILKQMSCF